MTDQPRIDPGEPLELDLTKYEIDSHRHQGGCPGNPDRVDREVVQMVEKSTEVVAVNNFGVPEERAAFRPGQKVVKVRCVDCATQVLFALTDGDDIVEVEPADVHS